MLRRLLPVCLAFVVMIARVADAQTLTLVPAAPKVALTETIRIDLVVLNDADEAIRYTPPREMVGRLVGGAVERNVTLKLLDRTEADAIDVPAKSFVRVGYALLVSDAPGGRVRIETFDPVLTTSLEIESLDKTRQNAAEAIVDAVRADPDFQNESGLVEYLAYRLRPHEPIYFVYGDEDPDAKFQLSVKYQVFDGRGSVADTLPWADNLFITYSQTSFWDLSGDSKPFFDNSYRPGVMFAWDRIDDSIKRDGQRLLPDWLRLDLQTGVQHESNGRDNGSRSLNTLFLQPAVTIGDRREWFVSFGPRFVAYVGDLSDNPDLEDYRGFGDLKLVVGQGGGIQLAAIGRVGDDWDRGSLQLDLSFPIRKLTGDSFDIYLHTQYFTGYGESLLLYDEHDSTFRAGFSVVR